MSDPSENSAGTHRTQAARNLGRCTSEYQASTGRVLLLVVTALLATSLLHDELKTDSVRVAGTPIDPDRIADTYWAPHIQPVAEWSAGTVFGGQS